MTVHLPAEWEKHEATWFAWPHYKKDWMGRMPSVELAFAEMARWTALSERVRILVNSVNHRKSAKEALASAGADLKNIEFFICKTDRAWIRDFGPFFVKTERGTEIVDFRFNAWANYPNHAKDDKVPGFVSKKLKLRRRDASHFVLEGGAIDVNGKGSLITTEECLLDKKVQVRNPNHGKAETERELKDLLGVSNILWLGKGIKGDDTHGHVDDLCRFVNSYTVVLSVEEDPKDVNYDALHENRERLQGMRLEDGSKLDVEYLPMPRPVIYNGKRLPASYANFYITNSSVLVPTFNDPNDRKALNILAGLFSGREVVGIHALDLVWGLGTIHCLTKQQPA